MQNAHIIVIEDEKDIADLVIHQLEKHGFSTHYISCGGQAMDFINNELSQIIAKKKNPLFLIDWMLPQHSGIELCKSIKNTTPHTPVIMVTALGQTENIVAGLDAGADDYITKPFDIHILQARIRTQLRKQHIRNESKGLLVHGDLEIDQEKCQAKLKTEDLQLTQTEYQILVNLMSRPGAVFTREKIIEHIQGGNFAVSSRTIDTHLVSLRRKLKDFANNIETIRGIGYRLKGEL